jgi:adenosylcobinamide amidohydrolase
MGIYRRCVEDEDQHRQLNLHVDPENFAGVYANWASVNFSDYEFTITFGRMEPEIDEGDVNVVVVSRINLSHRFMHELMDAMTDNWSKWTAREGIRNLPETNDD